MQSISTAHYCVEMQNSWYLSYENHSDEITQMKNHLTASNVIRNFPNSLVRVHSDEKPFDCYSCEKKFFSTLMSKYTHMKNYFSASLVTRNFYKLFKSKYNDMKNHLAAPSVTRNLPNFHIWMNMSEYTQIENHLAATHVTRKFLNCVKILWYEKPLDTHATRNFPNSLVRIHSDE